MHIRAFTESVSDAHVRYQVTVMRESAMIWAQVSPGGPSTTGGDTAGDIAVNSTNNVGSVFHGPQGGAMPRLCVALPNAQGDDGLPAATTVFGSRAEAVHAERIAARLARRTGLAIYACVELGDMGDLLTEVVVRRVLRELDEVGVSLALATTTVTSEVGV